jgi:hypothetical protein
MKKSDIIDAHNALLNDIKTVLAEYKAITGQDHPKADHLISQLGPYTMNWGKGFLQNRLDERRIAIITIPQEADIYVKTKEMKSSEKGQEFIASLKKRQDDIIESLHKVSKEFVDGFNKMLALTGLENWKVVWYPQEATAPMPRYIPSFHHEYFDIWMEKSKYARVHITINHGRDGWEMNVSTGLQGGTTLGKAGDEYDCFKAYVTIVEHSSAFQIWMENDYRELASKAYDLMEELNKADEDVRDPYAAWVRENN